VEFHHALFEALCDQGGPEEGEEEEEGEGEGGESGEEGGGRARGQRGCKWHTAGTPETPGAILQQPHGHAGPAKAPLPPPLPPLFGHFKLHGNMPQRERSAAFLGFGAPRASSSAPTSPPEASTSRPCPSCCSTTLLGIPTDYVHRSVILQYSTVLCCSLLNCTGQYCAVLCYTVLYNVFSVVLLL